MKNKKLVLVFTMVTIFLAMMVGFVSASNDLQIEIIGNNEVNNVVDNNVVDNNLTENNEVNNTTNNVTLNTNNTVGNNETLPQTGVEENTILLIAFIGIFAISAVYAYRKVRDYNNI